MSIFVSRKKKQQADYEAQYRAYIYAKNLAYEEELKKKELINKEPPENRKLPNGVAIEAKYRIRNLLKLSDEEAERFANTGIPLISENGVNRLATRSEMKDIVKYEKQNKFYAYYGVRSDCLLSLLPVDAEADGIFHMGYLRNYDSIEELYAYVINDYEERCSEWGSCGFARNNDALVRTW